MEHFLSPFWLIEGFVPYQVYIIFHTSWRKAIMEYISYNYTCNLIVSFDNKLPSQKALIVTIIYVEITRMKNTGYVLTKVKFIESE